MQRRQDANTSIVRMIAADALGLSPDDFDLERTADGVSAQVYRIGRGTDEWFLRLAERADENLEVDFGLLHRLRHLGVLVPEAVYVNHFIEEVDRSVLITRHIGGRPLALTDDAALTRTVAFAAGGDLARINQVTVDGFGWVDRSRRPHPPECPLTAELNDYADFVVHDLPSPWPGRFVELFSTSELARIEAVIAAELDRSVERAGLAHGDFTLDHVFHREGEYTGLIDFGEIRGTEPLFDLGVFQYSGVDDETPVYEATLRGYAEVEPLPDDANALILTSGFMKWLRQLGMWLRPDFTLKRDASGIARMLARQALPRVEAANR